MGNKCCAAEYSLGIDIGSTTAKTVLRKGEEVLLSAMSGIFRRCVKKPRSFCA